MKKAILASIALSVTVISHAGVTVNNPIASEDSIRTTVTDDTLRKAQQPAQPQKTAVQIADLPAGVKTALAGEKFTGWKADRAFWVTGPTVEDASSGKGAAGNTNLRSAKNATESMESPTGTTGTTGTVTNGSTTATGRTKSVPETGSEAGTKSTTGNENATGNAAAGTGTVANHNGYYEVELSRNTDMKTVRFDKAGAELK